MKKRDDIYITQIQQRIKSVNAHLKNISQSKFMKSELHKSAVIRELEVIGEAAKQISEETKKTYSNIPWNQIMGMRNRLIHGYFAVDNSIVWEVAKNQLPILEKDLDKAFLEVAPTIHPWRNCPSGYYYVHEHSRHTKPTLSNPSGITSVRAHCRKNPSGKDQLYPNEISLISMDYKNAVQTENIGKMSAPNNANDYDSIIAIWTNYWNDIFKPKEPLNPNIIKALFFSESSFRLDIKSPRVGANNYARGPLQITDQTRKILANEKGEIKEHYLTLTAKDVASPDIAIAAATRWLFHKKEQASQYLNREASWEEAVAHYKSYLRRKKDFHEQTGMKVFLESFAKLNAGK